MVLAVGERLGDLAPPVRLATPFGGGVGSTHQELCGAISGGLLVIGAIYGRQFSHQVEEKERAANLAALYRSEFLSALGDTRCQPIRDRYHGPNGSGTCAPVVERAAAILLWILGEERSPDGHG